MKTKSFICVTCGVQYPPGEQPPQHCSICTDDRQYINPGGQAWTTLDELNAAYSNVIEPLEEDVFAVYTVPDFAIHQRAHLIASPGGNILWDCISNIDASTVQRIRQIGGIRAIALSHPHYFSTILEWSKAFGDIPVYVNALDAQWLTYRNGHIQFWSGPVHELWDDMRIIRCGGHFPGASVLLDPRAGGRLFVGDTIQVTPGQTSVSFMYSYPNMIPLPKKEILAIRDAVGSLKYEKMYGAFGKYILQNAKQALEASVGRYLQVFEESVQ